MSSRTVPEAVGCHEIRTRGSADYAFLDLHVWFSPEMPLEEAHRLSHVVKDRLLAAFPSLADVIIHIEPGTGTAGTSGYDGYDRSRSVAGSTTSRALEPRRLRTRRTHVYS